MMEFPYINGSAMLLVILLACAIYRAITGESKR